MIPFLFLSCNSSGIDTSFKSLKLESNKLKKEIKIIQIENRNLRKCDTKIIVSKTHNLVFYDPTNFTIKLSNKRPSINNNNVVLCIPGAFTDNPKKNSNLIDGYFIVDGNLISNDINTDLSGICIISEKRPIIIPSINLTQASKLVVENKSSLFQQFLLLYNHKRKSNLKFENTDSSKRKLLRRALVEVDNHFFIVESKGQYSIIDFQKLLISNNVKNAIYLDMGTYSEGWYKNDDGKINYIGETMKNTDKQSNWIVFEKM